MGGGWGDGEFGTRGGFWFEYLVAGDVGYWGGFGRRSNRFVLVYGLVLFKDSYLVVRGSLAVGD